MIHLPVPRMIRYLLPDMYEAVSVSDFLDDIHSIEAQSRWKLLSPIAGPFCYTSEKLSEWEVFPYVSFNNVTLQKIGRNFKISDMTAEFIAYSPINPLRVTFGGSVDPNKLTEGRYFRVGVLYSPRKKWVCLERAEKFGSPQKDTMIRNLERITNAAINT